MKKITLFLSLTLSLTSVQSHAQWTESGNLKNMSWNYSFAGGSGTLTNSSSGISKISTPTTGDYLPKPASGEVMVTASSAEQPGASSFTLNGACGTACLTMVHTSGNGASPAPAKFIAKNFEAKSKVMSLSLKVTPQNTPDNYQAIWYMVVGNAAGSTTGSTGGGLISAAGLDDNNIYAMLRIRKASIGNTYALQVRYNDGTQANLDKYYWGWQTLSGVSLTNGNETQLDLFFNNTEQPQSYTFKGVLKTLAANAYHLYVNEVQKGTSTTEAPRLTKNYGPSAAGNQTYHYDGDLTGFSIYSREGAHSNVKDPTDPENKRFIYDNSASMVISGLKITHLVTSTTTPVTLTGFNGNATNTGIALNWQTASEQNNSHFILNHSLNGKDFSYLTRVEGNGTSNNVNHYSYTDKNPFAGINYYQLEQVDKDGTKTVIDKIVPVKYMVSEEIFAVSKISSNQLRAYVSSEKNEDAELSITDISGKVIYKSTRTLKQGSNQIDLFVPAKPGIYVATLKGTIGTKSVKFSL